MSEKKPNKGALFRNNRMRPDKQDPQMTGDALIQCPYCKQTSDHWIKAWTNTKQSDGERYQGLSFEAKKEQQDKSLAVAQPPVKDEAPAEFNDDIPF